MATSTIVPFGHQLALPHVSLKQLPICLKVLDPVSITFPGQGGLAFLGELESFTRLQIVLAPWPQGFPSGFRLPTLQAAPVSLNFPSEWVRALGLGLRVTGQRNPKEDAKETLIPT